MSAIIALKKRPNRTLYVIYLLFSKHTRQTEKQLTSMLQAMYSI